MIFMSLTSRIQALTAYANEVTGESDTTLSDAVASLADGYGSGSGGAHVIASGTFTGDGGHAANIPVGRKMPKTDFIFNIWLENGTTCTPTDGTIRIITFIQALIQSKFEGFALNIDGSETPSARMVYPTANGNGELINRSPRGWINFGSFTRTTTVATEMMNVLSLVRSSSDGFTLNVGKNSQYIFENGLTYNWELIYIGSNPTNDIVEI